MENHPLTHMNNRIALAGREILSLKHRGGFGMLALLLVLGVGAFLGSAPVSAQEQQQAQPLSAEVSSSGKVNINTADAQTLAARLKGVGDSRAAEIIRYRETYGPFGSADELIEVKGIGPATLDLNRDVITLE